MRIYSRGAEHFVLSILPHDDAVLFLALVHDGDGSITNSQGLSFPNIKLHIFSLGSLLFFHLLHLRSTLPSSPMLHPLEGMFLVQQWPATSSNIDLGKLVCFP